MQHLNLALQGEVVFRDSSLFARWGAWAIYVRLQAIHDSEESILAADDPTRHYGGICLRCPWGRSDGRCDSRGARMLAGWLAHSAQDAQEHTQHRSTIATEARPPQEHRRTRSPEEN